VFLLTASKMLRADRLFLLMKQAIYELLAKDEKLQKILEWVSEKSSSVDVPYEPAAVRAFYFAINHSLDRSLDRSLDYNLARAHELAFDHAHDYAPDFDLDLNLTHVLDCDGGSMVDAIVLPSSLYRASIHADRELQNKLQELNDQLPNTSWNNQENFRKWWKANGQSWAAKLRATMIEHRNIGHDWQFSEEEKDLLQQYYDANKLLVDCLNRHCCCQ
jgi:predicted NACHT family NTPase